MKVPSLLIVSLSLSLAAATLAMAAGDEASAAARLAVSKPDKNQLEVNLTSLNTLIETSSAARQIDASRASDAVQRRERARELYRAAREALAADNLDKSANLLSESRATFFDAVRLAAPEEVTAKKLENDYLMRLESVQALLGAYRRVSAEKAAQGVAASIRQIEAAVSAGETLARTRKFREARVELDRGYLLAKAGLTNLRSGDTLVRSLNFASKEEEYHYEVDRNTTHQMLIKVLVDEHKAAGDLIQEFLGKAGQLRAKADAAAAQGRYAEAVQLLEESTVELVRAIRNAGIYIPG